MKRTCPTTPLWLFASLRSVPRGFSQQVQPHQPFLEFWSRGRTVVAGIRLEQPELFQLFQIRLELKLELLRFSEIKLRIAEFAKTRN